MHASDRRRETEGDVEKFWATLQPVVVPRAPGQRLSSTYVFWTEMSASFKGPALVQLAMQDTTLT